MASGHDGLADRRGWTHLPACRSAD
ncbi:protein of unknown function [Azospirillum baldaniorum]|uniref:Uncharacterized protein n=1 Tax=Azospirillum baldaniorum TaxID=1064539 RepID=A0A9P1JTH0_9PROT|nr:protein of unknown function [Azospirillum baldaniorum]